MSLKIARLETFKYPNVVRYFYPTVVVSDQPECLQLFHPAGAPLWNGNLGQTARAYAHSYSLLYPDQDYNISIWWNDKWSFNSYYINMALPMHWDGELCSYVDLDLDVLWLTDRSTRVLEGIRTPGVYELDRDEYEERKVKYNYPPEIMARSEASLQKVLGLIERRVFPFDDSLLDWRPTPEMLELANLPDSATEWHLSNNG